MKVANDSFERSSKLNSLHPTDVLHLILSRTIIAMKFAYATPLVPDEDLVAQKSETAARESEIGERVRQLVPRCVQACVTTDERNFEQLV
ncbi:hypothetical protein TNCV_3088691 [Trichonephila clavipes]|uniref:Uncharacterized protein n=1 Tax=Trichonephila clavipes TaxID=2585209 RepID=A0A8X6RHD0_TRICX|nr:hypothetical protein TNCV_3088691 [Trichonephila clavipes]